MDEIVVSAQSSPSTSTSYVDVQVDVEEPPPQSDPPPSEFQSFSEASQSSDLVGSDVVNPSDPLSEIFNQNPNHNWPRTIALTLGEIVVLIVIIAVVAKLRFRSKHDKVDLGCISSFEVSKHGKSKFSTITEAIEASPSHSPFPVCVLIGEGEYHEALTVGSEKSNIFLIGEGAERTTIYSNASVDSHPKSTLRISGRGFMAQDLTIINTVQNGLAVENWSANSTFYKCVIKGLNATLRVNGNEQFYRGCQFSGQSDLVFGFARAFFQKCKFLSEPVNPEEKVFFSSQSAPRFKKKDGFVFHLCEFTFRDKSARNDSHKAFIAFMPERYAEYVVMQSYFDASVDGYVLGTPLNSTYFAIFGNTGEGPTMNVASYIHSLSKIEAAEYSLREFLQGGNWIPHWVERDVDLM